MNNGKEESAGAGGGIRNKYKKHKGEAADNADDLKKAIVDEIKNKKDDSTGKSNRQKKEGGGLKSRTEITITKIEITSEGKDGISKTKSSANVSNNEKNKKGAEMSISKVTEVSTQENKGGRARTREKDSNNSVNPQGNKDPKSRRGNKDGNNQNETKDKSSGQRITKTTEISSTTTTNQKAQVNRRGKSRESNNPNSQNQGKPNEVPNQSGRGVRGNNPNQNKDQQNPNQRLRGQPNQSNRDKSNQNNKNPQPNERGRGNKPNSQANPKSTTNLRAKSVTPNSNDKPSNRNQKDIKKNRPLSNSPQSSDNIPRNNTVSILIDQTGRIPKKEYVLNVRKLDTIKDNRRHKQTYNDAIEGEDKPISTTFNHNIIIVKNVTKDLRTVADVGDNEKIIHRYNYNYVPGIPNTGTHSIDESGKIQKKERIVSPRKNDVIVTEKKTT